MRKSERKRYFGTKAARKQWEQSVLDQAYTTITHHHDGHTTIGSWVWIRQGGVIGLRMSLDGATPMGPLDG